MAEIDRLEELEDVSNSSAYAILNDMVDHFDIPVDKSDAAKRKYSKLHAALVKAMTREKNLLEDAKSLKRQLDKANEDEEADGGPMTAARLEDSLREDVEAALAEAAMAQERQQLLQLEVTDLQRQRNELAARAEELAAEQAEALIPMINNLRNEVSALGSEVESGKEKEENAARELSTNKHRIEALDREIAALGDSKLAEKTYLFKIEGLPDKAKKQNEAFQGLVQNVASQVEIASNRVLEVEERHKVAVQRERELAEEHSKNINVLGRSRIQAESKERHCDDIKRDIDMSCAEAERILADQVDLDLKIKNSVSDLKIEQEALARKVREKDSLMRQYRTVESDLKTEREVIPSLEFQVSQFQRDQQQLSAKVQARLREINEVKRDLDINMNDFLQEELIGKEKALEFQLTYKQVAVQEEELAILKKSESERGKMLNDLSSQRDRVALSIAQKLAKVKEVETVIRIKDLEMAELKKIRREVERRIYDYEKLYEMVKNQRNKFVNLIQVANQSTTEMKDKSKILTNEMDILHTEVNNKDKLLVQSRSQHQTAHQERDALRIELGRFGGTFRLKQDMVDEQIAEVDKLSAIINQSEKAMIKLRRQYEVAIEARNYTGIMLIDRNDELCVLYEKTNTYEEVVKAGILELHRLDDEVRVLNISIKDIERSKAATVKLIPTIPVLDEDVARLQKALFETRREAEALSIALESPENNGRWKLLEGKIPDKDELAAKIMQLDERLNLKKEALLEKELILDEITRLSDRLREQASEGRADTLELAKRVNEYQGRMRAVTRKVMAIVSELSMYQATSLKLGAEKEDLEATVADARDRAERDDPPTDDCEREWQNMERRREMVQEAAERRQAEWQAIESRVGDVQTTADPRPNAYIPEQLGIPKPYSGPFTPFKPTEPGATMRHIRKPEIREIII